MNRSNIFQQDYQTIIESQKGWFSLKHAQAMIVAVSELLASCERPGAGEVESI